jgi:hypothetical protein
MARLSTKWRRFWGIRPGELRLPVRIVGAGRTMGEPVSGPHGRGWEFRHGRLVCRPPTTVPPGPSPAPPERPTDPPPVAELPLNVVADELPDEVEQHAREVVERIARMAPRPVLHARVVLRMLGDPALERPAIAKASLDVSGRPVRAHVAARRMDEAIDLLERRLRRNLEQLDELAGAHRHETGVASPGEWRHGDLSTERPEYFPRPAEERELVRRKSFALSPLTPEEASLEMATLDYDFHLFTNADTGDENVVRRVPDATVTVVQTGPVLPIDGAIERLNLTGEPFLFFVDAQTRRGNVLYLRYDGHYGLLEPAV